MDTNKERYTPLPFSPPPPFLHVGHFGYFERRSRKGIAA